MNHEQEYYGKMFPSVVEMAHGRAVVGRVFGYQVGLPGASGPNARCAFLSDQHRPRPGRARKRK